MSGEPKEHHSFWKAAYVRVFDTLSHLAAGNGVEAYDAANKERLAAFCKDNRPDGR